VTPGLTCPPSHFRAIPRTDLVGAPLTDAPLATALEGACRIACCGAPGCDGYAFAFTELRFSSSASCSLYANLSATAPNSFAASGLRVGVVLPNPSASTSPAGTPLPEGGWPQRGGSVTPTITESYSPTASTTPSPTPTWVPGFISTIGGNGDSGYGGDGGPATAASLCPSSVAVISTGSIIISDACNNRIRLVVSGIISTIAGNGAGGFGGDGSQATFARLNMPTSVTVTLTDAIIFADTNNTRIRQISPSGIISTIAGDGIATYGGDGGQATSASLRYPQGVAVTSTGAIVIADQSNNRIRLVAPSGIISTLAGNGV